MSIKKELYTKEPLLRTYTGKYVNILNPSPEEIYLDDIIIQLSNHCRFGGTLENHYSVLEHSLFVMDLVKNEEDKLAALMHDSSEAYLCDIPTPLKNLLPRYIEIEDKFMKVISEKFKFQYPFSKSILQADKEALEIEYNMYHKNKMSPNKSKMFLVDRFRREFKKYSRNN